MMNNWYKLTYERLLVDNNSFVHKAIRKLPKSDQYNAIRLNMIKRFKDTNRFCESISLCQTCGCFSSQIPNKHVLKPGKKLNSSLRRLLKKNQDEMGTPYQILSYNKIRKCGGGQHWVTTCRICNLQLKKMVDKPHKLKKNSAKEQIFKRKKKSKKNKFAGLSEDAVLSANPQKRKYDEIIVLDTPQKNIFSEINSKTETIQPKITRKQSDSKIDQNKSNPKVDSEKVIAEIDNSVIYIDKTPTCNKTIDSDNQDIVDLITPKSTPETSAENETIVDLSTPNQDSSEAESATLSPLKIKNKTPIRKIKKSNFPLVTHNKRKYDKLLSRRGFEAEESSESPSTSPIPSASPIPSSSKETTKSPKKTTNKTNELIIKINKRLSKSKAKSGKKKLKDEKSPCEGVLNKRFNSLQKLLKTDELNKTASNLEQFLKSIS